MVVNDYGFRIEDGLQRDLIGLFTFTKQSMKFHNFAMPMYIPVEKYSEATVDGLSNGYISPKLTELFKINGTVSFISDIKREALDSELPVIEFGNYDNLINIKISRESISITKNGETHTTGSRTFNVRHLTFTFEYHETNNTTIKIYDLDGEQIDIFTIPKKIDSFKIYANSIGTTNLAKISELKLWSRILSQQDIKKNIALGDGKTKIILDLLTYQTDEQFNNIKISPFILEYDHANNIVLFKENDTMSIQSKKILPYGTSVVLYNGNKPLELGNKLDDVVADNKTLYEMLYPSELKYNADGTLSSNEYFQVKDYTLCKNITFGSSVTFPITQNDYNSYMQNNKQITCGFSHYGYLFILDKDIGNVQEGYGKDKIFGYKEYYENFLKTTYNPSSNINCFILGNYSKFNSYKPINTSIVDIYYSFSHPNEGYIIPLYNIYSYNYSTNKYELLVDRSSGDYYNRSNTLPYESVDLGGFDGKSLLIVVYKSNVVYDPRGPMIHRDGNTVYAKALVNATTSLNITPPSYNITTKNQDGYIDIIPSDTRVYIRAKEDDYSISEANTIYRFSQYKEESLYVYHKDKSLIKYQPSILTSDFNNVCNVLEYKNQYEHGTGEHNKFDLFGSSHNAIYGDQLFMNKYDGLYINISNYPVASKSTVSTNEKVNFNEGVVFYNTDNTYDGIQLVLFNGQLFAFRIYNDNGIYRYDGSQSCIESCIGTNINKIKISIYGSYIVIDGRKYEQNIVKGMKYNKIFVPTQSFIHEVSSIDFLSEYQTNYGLIESCIYYKKGDILTSNENLTIKAYDYISNMDFVIYRAISYNEFGRTFEQYSYKSSFPSSRFLRADASEHDLLYMDKRIDSMSIKMSKNIENIGIEKEYSLNLANKYIIMNSDNNISMYRSNNYKFIEKISDNHEKVYPIYIIHPISGMELLIPIISYNDKQSPLKSLTELRYYTNSPNQCIISSKNISNILTEYTISSEMNEKIFFLDENAPSELSNQSLNGSIFSINCDYLTESLGAGIFIGTVNVLQKAPNDIAYFEDNDIDIIKCSPTADIRVNYNGTIYNNISDIASIDKSIDNIITVFGYEDLYFYKSNFKLLGKKYIDINNILIEKEIDTNIFLLKYGKVDLYYNNIRLDKISVKTINKSLTLSSGYYKSSKEKSWGNPININNSYGDIINDETYDYFILKKDSYNINTRDLYLQSNEIPKNKNTTTELVSISNNEVFFILSGYIKASDIILDNNIYKYQKSSYMDILEEEGNVNNASFLFYLKGIEYDNISFFSKDIVFNINGFNFSLIRNIDRIKLLFDISTPNNDIFIKATKLSINKYVSSDIRLNTLKYSIVDNNVVVYKVEDKIICNNDLQLQFSYELDTDIYNNNDFILKDEEGNIVSGIDKLTDNYGIKKYTLYPLDYNGNINQSLITINNIDLSYEQIEKVSPIVNLIYEGIAVGLSVPYEWTPGKYGVKIYKNNDSEPLEPFEQLSHYYLYDKLIPSDNIYIQFYFNSIIFNRKVELDNYSIPYSEIEVLSKFPSNEIPTYFFDLYGSKYKEYDKISCKEYLTFGDVKGYQKMGISSNSILFSNAKKTANILEFATSRKLFNIDTSIDLIEQETNDFNNAKLYINGIEKSHSLIDLIEETNYYKRYRVILSFEEKIESFEFKQFDFCNMLYILLTQSQDYDYSYILDKNNFPNISIDGNEYIVNNTNDYKWLETDYTPTRVELSNGRSSAEQKPHFSYGKFKKFTIIEEDNSKCFPFRKTYEIDNETYKNSIHNSIIEGISTDPKAIDFNIFVQTTNDIDINNNILFTNDNWKELDYSNINQDYFYNIDGTPKIKDVLFVIGKEDESDLDLYDDKPYLYKRELIPYKPSIENPMRLVIGSQLFFLKEVLPGTIYRDGYKCQKGKVFIDNSLSTIVDYHYKYEYCRTVKDISDIVSSYSFSNGCSNENSEIYKIKRSNGSIEISTSKYYLFNKFNKDRIAIDKGCAVYLFEGNKHLPILKDTMFIENIVSNIKLESISFSLKSKIDYIYDLKILNYNTYENIPVLDFLSKGINPYLLYDKEMVKLSALSRTILDNIYNIKSINPLGYKTLGEMFDSISECGIFIWFNEIEQLYIDFDVYTKSILEIDKKIYIMKYENSPNDFFKIDKDNITIYGVKPIDKIDINGYNYLENDFVINEREDLIINTYELTHENTVPMYERSEYVVGDKIYPVNNINLATNDKTNNQEILEYQTNQLKPKLIELYVTGNEFNSIKLKTGVMCVVRRNGIDLSYKFIQANKI